MASVEELRRENRELRSRLAELEQELEAAATAAAERSRVVSIVEASSEAILSTALDETILAWNRAAERLYGYTPGEAIGRSYLELVPFERLVEHRDAVARALVGEAVIVDSPRRRRDGRLVAVMMIYARLADPTGKPIGLSILAHASG